MASTDIKDYYRRSWGIGDRIGLADGPPGTIKRATGPTKKNVGSTSPVYNEATGHIHKRTN